MKTNTIKLGDCLELIKEIPDNSIDLIVTDPPYLIKNTKAGGSTLSKSIQGMNDEISKNNLTNGYDIRILDELVRVNKKINMYIWCNKEQIPMYIDYFVNDRGCSFDILVWNKTNATPLFNNKYLTDKEYCLYFRKGGYCQPENYEDAKTIFQQPINAKDKSEWNHPTIKPLDIIQTLIKNSSKPNDIVLDTFVGSGTTCVASKMLGRRYIGYEINPKYFSIATERIAEVDQIKEKDKIKGQISILDMI